MISKAALRRYIDSRIRMYLDINMFETRILSQMMNEMKSYEEMLMKYDNKRMNKDERRDLLELTVTAVREVEPRIKKSIDALKHGDVEMSNIYLKQIVPLAWKLEGGNSVGKIWNATKFVGKVYELIHSF